MTLSTELIQAAKEVFPKVAFVESEEVIAQHILFEQFVLHYPNWPKVIFYIVADEVFGVAREKDKSGNLGRKIKFDFTLVPSQLKPK